MQLALLLRLSSLALAPHDLEDIAQRFLPGIETGSDFAPLLLAEDAVGGAVDEEDLFLLGQLALDEPGADHVDDPHLDVLGGDLQRLGDALVLELAGAGGGGEGGEGEEAHLAVQDVGVEGVVVHEGVVLVAEVGVVLELLLGYDLEQLGPHGVRVREGLDGGQRGEVVEVEVRAGEEGGFEGAESEVGGLGGAEGGGVLGVEGA
jgi:hypothetical protein